MHVRVVMPESARLPSSMKTGESRYGDAFVAVKDAVNGHAIDFDRVIDVPAGRVQPGKEYATWRGFVRDADALIGRDVTIDK